MRSTLHTPPRQLAHHVADELAWSPDAGAGRVTVQVSAAVVTLTGEVGSVREQGATVRAALRVRGVGGVVDLLTVGPAARSRPDADLARDATAALALAGTDAAGVLATSAGQVITLTGTVRWHFQRTDAEAAVRAVPGSAGVVNAVALVPDRPFAPLQAASSVTAALHRSAAVDADNVHVTTSGSTIELFGHVPSATQRDEAGRAAWSTPGVTDVANNLRVLDFDPED
ncbi:BON domain-containing protein [Aquipuribacter hungaricus]|uniref:BON domain-containing protein n=1 Tax=Aquipuribacter hungaricus TaxID=545624 RepID=A0ABV7WDQ4_9MICO